MTKEEVTCIVHRQCSAFIESSLMAEFCIGTMAFAQCLKDPATKTKAAAVATWLETVWMQYKAYKATIAGWPTADDYSVPAEMLDYSSCGAPPYTVGQIMDEIFA